MQSPYLLAGRLESPADIVRKMGSSVALAFSKVIDPKNPLYLDDSFKGETIDWEFGFATSNSKDKTINAMNTASIMPAKISSEGTSSRTDRKVKHTRKSLPEPKMVDPDEIIDPATLGYETGSDYNDDDDYASESSGASSDSSLQPYDLSDDDSDLKTKLSHLVDVVGALRKTDDVNGVSILIWLCWSFILSNHSQAYLGERKKMRSCEKDC